MPVGDRQLAGDDRRPAKCAVLDHLQEIGCLVCRQRANGYVISAMERYVADHHIPVVLFKKGERKDDI